MQQPNPFRLLVNSRPLAKALTLVAKVVPTRTTRPVLGAARLDVTDARGVELTATDLSGDVEYAIRIRLDAQRIGPAEGAALIPRAQLSPVAKALPPDVVGIDVDDEGAIAIDSGGRGTSRIPADLDVRDHPDTPTWSASSWYSVRADDVVRLITRTLHSTDPDSTRFALGGILTEFSGDGTMQSVATDGRRLAIERAHHEVERNPGAGPQLASGTDRFILPCKAARVLLDVARGAAGGASVDFAFLGDSLFIRRGKVEVWARPVEGRFPRYADVLPAEVPGASVTVDATELLDAFAQAAAHVEEEARGVSVLAHEGALVLEVERGGSMRYRRVLDVVHEGEAMDACLDPAFLVAPLRALGKHAGAVTVELHGYDKPVVLRCGTWTYVVMPLTRDKPKGEGARRDALSTEGRAMLARLAAPAPVEAESPAPAFEAPVVEVEAPALDVPALCGGAPDAEEAPAPVAPPAPDFPTPPISLKHAIQSRKSRALHSRSDATPRPPLAIDRPLADQLADVPYGVMAALSRRVAALDEYREEITLVRPMGRRYIDDVRRNLRRLVLGNGHVREFVRLAPANDVNPYVVLRALMNGERPAPTPPTPPAPETPADPPAGFPGEAAAPAPAPARPKRARKPRTRKPKAEVVAPAPVEVAPVEATPPAGVSREAEAPANDPTPRLLPNATPADLSLLPSDVLEAIASRADLPPPADLEARRAQRPTLAAFDPEFRPSLHDATRLVFNRENDRARLALYMKRRGVDVGPVTGGAPAPAVEAPPEAPTLTIAGRPYAYEAFLAPDGARVVRLTKADGTTYDVAEGAERCTCECPHFVNRLAELPGQFECKHVNAVIGIGLVAQPPRRVFGPSEAVTSPTNADTMADGREAVNPAPALDTPALEGEPTCPPSSLPSPSSIATSPDSPAIRSEMTGRSAPVETGTDDSRTDGIPSSHTAGRPAPATSSSVFAPSGTGSSASDTSIGSSSRPSSGPARPASSAATTTGTRPTTAPQTSDGTRSPATAPTPRGTDDRPSGRGTTAPSSSNPTSPRSDDSPPSGSHTPRSAGDSRSPHQSSARSCDGRPGDTSHDAPPARGFPIVHGRPTPRFTHGTPCGAFGAEGDRRDPTANTQADAGAPAIGLASRVVSCHGHTEPMGVEVAGAVPGASWGLLMALSELRDEAAGDEAPPTPPATDPEADAPAPRGKLGRLSLLGLVEAEAGRLARRNAAGELMARALRALAEDLRWTRARTPAEHDARMDAWDSWVRDHEPMEATR